MLTSLALVLLAAALTAAPTEARRAPEPEAALTGIEYAARPFRRRIIAAKIKRTAG